MADQHDQRECERSLSRVMSVPLSQPLRPAVRPMRTRTGSSVAPTRKPAIAAVVAVPGNASAVGSSTRKSMPPSRSSQQLAQRRSVVHIDPLRGGDESADVPRLRKQKGLHEEVQMQASQRAGAHTERSACLRYQAFHRDGCRGGERKADCRRTPSLRCAPCMPPRGSLRRAASTAATSLAQRRWHAPSAPPADRPPRPRVARLRNGGRLLTESDQSPRPGPPHAPGRHDRRPTRSSSRRWPAVCRPRRRAAVRRRA